MSDSDLTIQFSALQIAVGDALGYGRDTSKWGTDRTARVNKSIEKGYADFLKEYDWSFMRIFATFTTSAPYDTGTIAITADGTDVTLTTGTWPAWAAQGVLYYGGKEYDIASRTGDSVIVLEESWPNDTISGESYELRRLSYDLPDDFGQPLSWYTYTSGKGRKPIHRTSVAYIYAAKSLSSHTSYPRKYAVRPKAFAGTSEQRYEAVLYPIADAEYQIRYQYEAVAAQTIDSGTTYMYGGQIHSQAIQDCCIAAGRYLYQNVPLSQYVGEISIACQKSIEKDKMMAPAVIGMNADNSDRGTVTGGIHLDDDNRYVTVNDTLYD